MKTYRVQFSPFDRQQLFHAWDKIQAENPEDAAIGILKRNHVILARYIGKKCVAHVADPKFNTYPNGMPMVTHGFVLEIGKEASRV